MKKGFFIYLLIFSVLLSPACGRNKEIDELSLEIKEAPLFTLPDLEGKEDNLEDLLGEKIVLLDFQTIFCPYCVEIIPFLNDLSVDYRGEVEIVGIFIHSEAEKVWEHITGLNIAYTILLDKEGVAAGSYKITGVPTLFILDFEGKIRYQGHDPEEARRVIETLIK